MIAIKFGGSVITDKSRRKRARKDVLCRIAGEVRDVDDLLVVHGAGSYGHVMARQAGLGRSTIRDDQVVYVSEISRDVRELNLMVVDALRSEDLKAISIAPASFLCAKEGLIRNFDTLLLKGWVELDMVPVAFGDIVLDEVWGASVVSGDQIMYLLAEHLQPDRAVFVTDVDGVLTHPPGHPDSRLLEVISPFDAVDTNATAPDVTDSIRGKIEWMFRIASKGVECLMVNGLIPGRVRDAVMGKEVKGTRVVYEGR